MSNVLLKKEYPKEYTSAVSTRVSNALLVGEIIGQVIIRSIVNFLYIIILHEEKKSLLTEAFLPNSLTCDYMSRKTAIIFTTAMIVIGGILATAAHGVTINGMFWMMTIARGIIGFGTIQSIPFPRITTLITNILTVQQLTRIIIKMQKAPEANIPPHRRPHPKQPTNSA